MDLGHVQCHQAFDKLMIPNFTLPGSVLSNNHGLATFVHERLEWTLVDKFPEKLETEWSCIDVAGHKIINVYKHPPSWLTPKAIPTLPICMLAISTANVSTRATAQHLLTVRNWLPGQQPTTLLCSRTQREQLVSSLINGTSAPTQTWPSRVSAGTTDCLTDVF